MTETTKYKLVTGGSSTVTDRVNELLSENWELYGQVVITQHEHSGCLVYCQTLVKKEYS